MHLAQRILKSPAYLLLAAAVFHLLLTTSLLIAGKKQLLPNTFDINGTAVSITPDGTLFRKDAIVLADYLRQGDLSGWINQPYAFFVKIYSVSFAVCGELFGGQNILTAEPLNLLYYLSMLYLVYKLTAQILNSRAGLVAAVIVGVWPSMLLHTTQLVKDPLFICEMLALVLILTRFIQRTYTDRKWLLDVACGGLLGILLWKTRSDMAIIVLSTIVLAGFLILVRLVLEKKILVPNAMGITLILAITLAGMTFLRVYRIENHPERGFKYQSNRVGEFKWWQLPQRVGELCDGFIIEYRLSGSNVGTDVRITNPTDLVLYLPRALAIGLFAPFPSMWFESGTLVGPMARRISGIEMVFTYAIEILAAFSVWRMRRSLPVWLLVSIVMLGVVSLGLVVVNVGALYRQRYFFLILLIVLAAGQLAHWFPGKDQSVREVIK